MNHKIKHSKFDLTNKLSYTFTYMLPPPNNKYIYFYDNPHKFTQTKIITPMTTREAFMKNAVFEISKTDNGTTYINGTLYADRIYNKNTEKIVVYSMAQQIPPEDLEDAIDFCKTRKGRYAEKIDVENSGERNTHPYI